MINEKRIQYLLTVAQEQNITTAAKKLYISQPALSRMRLDLEQELGTPLFIRERNALRLTQAGAVYLRGCRQILAIDRSVKREISDLLSSRRGKITLAVTALTGEFLLPRILNAFEAEYPNVKLELYEEKMRFLNEAVKNGKADLALVRSPNDPELTYELVMENPVYVQVPPFYFRKKAGYRPGTQNPSIAPSELNGQPIVLLKKGRGMREEAERLFLQHQITPSEVIETENIHLANTLVQLNKGFSFIPDFAVHGFFSDDASSVYCQLDGYSFVRPLYCCFSHHRYLTQAERFLLDLIRQMNVDNSKNTNR